MSNRDVGVNRYMGLAVALMLIFFGKVFIAFVKLLLGV
jgi:hypothetical protein